MKPMNEAAAFAAVAVDNLRKHGTPCEHGFRVPGALYCEICGQQLKQRCPGCLAVYDMGQRFCFQCGDRQTGKRP